MDRVSAVGVSERTHVMKRESRANDQDVLAAQPGQRMTYANVFCGIETREKRKLQAGDRVLKPDMSTTCRFINTCVPPRRCYAPRPLTYRCLNPEP